MSKALAALGVAGFGVLLIGGLLYLVRVGNHASTIDSVRMIAGAASDRYAESPTATLQEIEAVAMHLHSASVIYAKPGRDGRPEDPYGTPFRFAHRPTPPVAITRVTSAGPDRRFDTPDDLWCEVLRGPDGRSETRSSPGAGS